MSLSTNLVNYWKLDESSGDAADSAGSLTLTNTSSATFGSALIGNGHVGNSAGFFHEGTSYTTLGTASPFTFNAWIWMSSLPSGQNDYLLSISDATNFLAYSLYYREDGILRLRWERARDGVAVDLAQTTTTLSTSTWHMVTGTYNGSTLELFLDGESVATASASGVGSSSSGSGVTIGGTYASTQPIRTNVKVDECAVWTRQLGDGEIRQLYNSRTGLQYPFTSPPLIFDDVSSGWSNSLTAPTSLTFSHTCTGSNMVLYVMAGIISSNSITGITYNGTAMTLIDSYTGIGTAMDKIYLYMLTGPASGTNTVSIQTSGSATGALYANSASYIGAAQTGQPPHQTKNQTTGTSLTTTLDTSASPSTDNCWQIGGYALDGNFTVSAGAGTTLRSTDASIKNWLGIMDNNAAIHPAGSNSIVHTSSSSCVMSCVSTSLAPFVAAAAASNMTFMKGKLRPAIFKPGNAK